MLSLDRNRGVIESHHLPHIVFPGWYDAMIEDTERVLLGFIHGARAANPGGVEVMNYTGVQELIRRDGRVVGARIEGLGEVETGCVMSCAGATRSGEHVTLCMNLLVDQLPMSADGCAVGLRHPDDGRNIFVVPWKGRSIIGTHSRSYPYSAADSLRVELDWIDDFLSWIRPVHPEFSGINRSDVRFVHAGLLPADAPGSDRPLERWKIEQRSDGEIVVQGVKWTTAYAVSAQAVKRAVSLLGRPDRGVARRGNPTPLPDTGEWLDAYLSQSPDLDSPILPGRSALKRGEVLFAVEREWARGLGDVLLRRTGVASAGHPGVVLVEATAALLQQTLGWSDAERRSEVEAFHEDFHFAGNVPVD
jgi:glycerol-3-phosphate dehydrogenase